MKIKLLLLSLMLTLICQAQYLHPRVYSTFDNLPIDKSDTFNNGADRLGGITTFGRYFSNSYDTTWGSWSGWALSNMRDDSTQGFTNQYSAITGSGVSGTSNYMVAYQSPVIVFDSATAVSGAYITNNAYAYYEMLNGSNFSKKFGGTTGNDPDYFKLIVKCYLNGYSVATNEMMLADYTSSNNDEDYILNTWQFFDFDADSSFDVVADSIVFSFESTDNGNWGINTPTYFCMDDLNATSNLEHLPEHIEMAENQYYNGADDAGGFMLSHLYFPNSYNQQWDSWDGWSLSTEFDDTTSGFQNQYSPISKMPAWKEGWLTQHTTFISHGVTNSIRSPYLKEEVFKGDHIYGLVFTPTGAEFLVNNTTYTYLDMLNGSGFSKKFGGDDGTDPDYLRLITNGIDINDNIVSRDTLYLADFRFESSEDDYILKKWTKIKVERCNRIEFKLESIDLGQYGMNTPSYFAMALRQHLPSSVKKINKARVLAYPNPAFSKITFDADHPIESIAISSLEGRLLAVKNGIGSTESINVLDLPVGTYIAHIKTTQGISITKLIKL